MSGHDLSEEVLDLLRPIPAEEDESVGGSRGGKRTTCSNKKPTSGPELPTSVQAPTYEREGKEAQEESATADLPTFALRREGRRAWDQRRDVAVALAAHLGLDPFGDNRSLRLGGNDIVVRFAVEDESSEWKLVIVDGWPGAPRSALALHEAFGMTVTGKLDKIGGPIGARWKDRMLAELGFVELPSLRFPDLPADAPATARKTWRWIDHLLRVRRWTEPAKEPIALSAPFLVDWSGGDLTLKEAIAGKRWLDRHGYIVRCGEVPTGRGKPLVLWLPMDPETGVLAGIVADREPDDGEDLITF